ncbi:MAG: hypothetical protein AAEJ52_19855 [Myxococcota bacterium]
MFFKRTAFHGLKTLPAGLLFLSCVSHAGGIPTAISEVVTLEIGTEVTVEGKVVAAAGLFQSSYNDEGFSIHDGTGGLFILTGKENLGLKRGEQVRVEGLVDNQSGTRAIGSTEVVKVRRGPVVFSPSQVGQLAAECSCDPMSFTEGDIITVRGTAVDDVQPDSTYGFKLFLDDGSGVAQIFINTTADIDVEKIKDRLLTRGTDLCVRGVVADFAGVGYELLPRTRKDIRRARPHKRNPCR